MIKKIALIAVAVLCYAGLTSAQESYSLSLTAPQQARVTRAVTVLNGATCIRFGQAIGCTQAQACTAAGAAGGASCTAAQARAANARIYPNTQPGREELASVSFARDVVDFTNNAVAFDQAQFCTRFKAASQANQDSACTAIGYTAGCEPCP